MCVFCGIFCLFGFLTYEEGSSFLSTKMLVKMQLENEGLILIHQCRCALPFWLWGQLKWEESQRKYMSLVITSVHEKDCNKSTPLVDISSVCGQSTQAFYQPEVGRTKAISPAAWYFCD